MASASQVAEILRVLFEGDASPAPDCRACQEQLAAYVDAEMAGLDAEPGFSAVRAHLQSCENCQVDYQELRELLALERADEMTAPPAPAAFDFGYLEAPVAGPDGAATTRKPASARTWWWDTAGRLIIRFSADLLSGLATPGLQPSYLKGTRASEVEYAMTDPAEDVEVRVRAAPSQEGSAAYDVVVDVEAARRGGWPHLAGILVTLRTGKNEAATTRETDAFGTASFEDIPAEALPELVFEITIP
jgi:hypothetical protein